MKKLTQHLRTFFPGNSKNSEQIHFSKIRPSRCVYFLAYALELVFYTLRTQFLPVGFSIAGIGGYTIMKSLHMIASLVVMLLWSEKFKPLLRGSAVVMLLGFVPYVFLPTGPLRLIFGTVGYIGLGGVVTGARCGYAFACNNSERLFGILAMFFTVTIVRLANAVEFNNVFTLIILPLALLFGMAYCLWKFKEEDFEVKQETDKPDAKGLYWAFAFFILYFTVDGYRAELSSSSFTIEYMLLLLGCLLAGLLLAVNFFGLRISTWHLWNTFFLFSIGMGVFSLLAPQLGSQKPQYFFCGLTFLGWPLCIYTLGCAQRRFASYKLLKRCTLIYVLLSPLTTLASDLTARFTPEKMPLAALVYILTLTIVLLMFSPFSYKYLFSSLWMKDIYKSDMQILQERVDKANHLEQYNLTPRQKEVAVLLLAAKTRRQIAGELKLSESTVKMHAGELYKKLGINSRTELFRKFGVAEAEEPEN